MRRLFVSLCTVCLITLACRAGDPAEMLPAGAIASVQLNNLAGLIDRVEKAGLIEAFYSTPQGLELLQRPEFKKALAVKAIVEQQTGMPVLELAKTLAGGRGRSGSLWQAGCPAGIPPCRPDQEPRPVGTVP
jgi:hypothetical protein